MAILKKEDISSQMVEQYAPKLNLFLKHEDIIRVLQEGNSIAVELENMKKFLIKNFTKDAEQQKKLILQDAENLKNKFTEEGRQQGREAAWNDIAEKFTEFEQVIEETKKNLLDMQENIIEQVKADAARLALVVAKKVTLNQIEVNEKLFINFITKVIEETKEKREVNVQVNPKDYEIIKDNVNVISEHMDVAPRITLHKNSSIKKRGVFIDLQSGFVDAGIERQINKIAKALFDEQD